GVELTPSCFAICSCKSCVPGARTPLKIPFRSHSATVSVFVKYGGGTASPVTDGSLAVTVSPQAHNARENVLAFLSIVHFWGRGQHRTLRVRLWIVYYT